MRRRRQTFKPPKPKQRQSFRFRRGNDTAARWRYWAVSGGSRTIFAFGFLLVPSLRLRLGDASLVAICIVLGAIASIITGVAWHYSGGRFRRDLTADVVSLVLTVPIVAVAVSIQVADVRFGGRGNHFLASAVAVLFSYLIVVVIATYAGAIRDRTAQIAALPAALVIAAVIGGAGRFSSGNVWKGVSLAWMLAVAGTLIFAFLPRSLRGFIAPTIYVPFALIILITSSSANGESMIGTTSAGQAMVLTLVVGIILIGIPFTTSSKRNAQKAVRNAQTSASISRVKRS